MGENTKIEWCHHTFNPWVGCTKVSPACDRCYAESWAKRTGHPELWAGARRRTSVANWRLPLKLDHAARLVSERHRVFCASLADVFDNQVPEQWRDDLWDLIAATPDLDWLLLTKRPQNIVKMLPKRWPWPMPNVWLGTTVENQEEADRRIPHLLAVPAKVHFLSCEPLLGEVDLTRIAVPNDAAGKYADHGYTFNALQREDDLKLFNAPAHVGWVICGGESGSKDARPMHPAWARSLRDQCAGADVAFHFKQWGEWAPVRNDLDMLRHARGLLRHLKIRGMPVMADESDLEPMGKVGKKRAGRLLDGREHNGLPRAA